MLMKVIHWIGIIILSVGIFPVIFFGFLWEKINTRFTRNSDNRYYALIASTLLGSFLIMIAYACALGFPFCLISAAIVINGICGYVFVIRGFSGKWHER